MVPFRFRGRWGGGGGGGGGGVIAWQLSSLSLVVVLGPQLTGPVWPSGKALGW